MKISFEIKSQYESNPVETVLKQIAISAGHEIVASSEADLVIASEPRACLAWLKAGKQVRQFFVPMATVPATGLIESYPERFKLVDPINSTEFLSELFGKKVSS